MDSVADRAHPAEPVSRRHSLRTRLTLIFSALLLVVISVLAIAWYSQIRGDLLALDDATLTDLAASRIARAALSRLILVSSLLMAGSVALVWWMSRRLILPLEKLTAAAESVAAGDFTRSELDDRGQDEISRLARAFRIMSLRVQDIRAQLQGDLTERTDELRATYKTLQKTLDDLAQKDRSSG